MGHLATWASRLNRADMLIWLDLPVGLRLWRVLWRAVTGLGRTRPDMADGCPERLRSLPEFFGYIWQTRNSARTKIERLIAIVPAGCAVVHLRSDADSAAFLRSVQPLRCLCCTKAARTRWSSSWQRNTVDEVSTKAWRSSTLNPRTLDASGNCCHVRSTSVAGSVAVSMFQK